jgi:hypothetical protein
MTMVRTATYVHYYSEQLVKSVWILGVIDSVEQAKLQWECDSVRQLDELLSFFLVLEPFEMKRQDIWQPLDFHALLCFLKPRARVARELVSLTKHLGSTELSQARCDTRVWFDIDG